MAGKKLPVDEVRWVHAIFGVELSDFLFILKGAHYFGVNMMPRLVSDSKLRTAETGSLFCIGKKCLTGISRKSG